MHADESTSADWAAALYDACAAQFVLYGRALGLSHPESEDVLQETFRSLLALATPPREPRFYALRSFRNRALNHRRSLWRRLTRELESVRWFEKDASESPNERAALAALTRLPPEQREVIVLKFWNDLTFEAIGELLQLSPHTAAGRYRYGMNKLRAELAAFDHLDATEHAHHELSRPAGNPAAWLPTPNSVAEG